MHLKTFKADSLLLLTAAIWGFAFVAQRAGLEYVGPFTYNAVRFALGGLSLMPLLTLKTNRRQVPGWKGWNILYFGALAGVALFLGSSFQQVGLQYTTAGKAGFITGLYVIIVPILGLIWGAKAGKGVWLGAVLAVTGLYFLSVEGDFSVNYGDLLELVCALFFAIHVLIIGWVTPKFNAVRLSIIQFFTTSLLSLIVALFYEEIFLADIIDAAIPIVYGGVFSAGVAYTLQVVAQKDAPSAHAAIILSLESVFAVLGGWMLLSEDVTIRILVGCGLMLGGMLAAQVQRIREGKVS
ncbi:MAG: DMT family transporter [Bacteroidales bacterium]|nr:DMT family transporter [Bacteroidales bacterium]MCF8336822.1 DMT family transporter [Bacteroidales bacterium]